MRPPGVPWVVADAVLWIVSVVALAGLFAAGPAAQRSTGLDAAGAATPAPAPAPAPALVPVQPGPPPPPAPHRALLP